jgi:hypothetical protein
MRKLSESYIPGDQSVLEKPATRSDDVSLLCAVGSIRVMRGLSFLLLIKSFVLRIEKML